MNETLRTIAQRYSCRSFDGKILENEKIEAIALAAVQSPSAVNHQPWQIVVIKNKLLIDEMDAEGMRVISEWEDMSLYEKVKNRSGSMFYNAPCMFLILKQNGTDLDTGIVCENIALATSSLNLGNVICGMAEIPFKGLKGEYFKKRVGLSGDWEFGVAVLVGYAMTEGKPHEPDMSKIRYID